MLTRRFLFSLTVAVGIAVGLVGGQATDQQQAAQRGADAMAKKIAEEYARRSAMRLGSLSADASRAILRWDSAIQKWKKEKGAGARPLLAEGVLFDCLSRFHGIVTTLVSSEEPVHNVLSGYEEEAARRPGRAAKAFDKALKLDPTLTEARFRQARLRAADDPAARRELETLGTGSFGVISYLAAISRAETAHGLEDADGARRWYARAMELMPGAPAPHLGLAALAPPRSLPFETFQPDDPYYSYPCTVLTQSVDAELSKRVAAVTIK